MHSTPIECTSRLETIIKNANLPGGARAVAKKFYSPTYTHSGKGNVSADNRIFSSIKKQSHLLRNMQEYNEFPPYKYFTRVLKTCPRSALLYVQIWTKRGRNMDVHARKKDIRKDYLISPTMFRNLLVPLMFLNLIYFVEDGEKFQIDMSGPHANG